MIAPYTYTALDLRNRLRRRSVRRRRCISLGTDELGRDVLSRLVLDPHQPADRLRRDRSSAVLGTSLGFLAAHFRGLVEQVVLMLVDFQASMPFLILALAVLAFFGNSLLLFICLMGFHRLGALRAHRARPGDLRRRAGLCRGGARSSAPRRGGSIGAHILPNIASTLIVSMTLAFPEIILLESGLSFLGPRRAAAADLARQHGRLRPRIPRRARRGSCWRRPRPSC